MHFLQQLEKTSAHFHGNTHNDAFTDATDTISLSMIGSFEQMIRGPFKGSQHHHTVLDFREALTGHTANLTSVGHEVSE